MNWAIDHNDIAYNDNNNTRTTAVSASSKTTTITQTAQDPSFGDEHQEFMILISKNDQKIFVCEKSVLFGAQSNGASMSRKFLFLVFRLLLSSCGTHSVVVGGGGFIVSQLCHRRFSLLTIANDIYFFAPFMLNIIWYDIILIYKNNGSSRAKSFHVQVCVLCPFVHIRYSNSGPFECAPQHNKNR